MKNIRIGILGMGRIGKIHLENLCTRIPGAEVVGVMNPSAAGLEYAGRFNVPLLTQNADELIGHPGIDAVVIAAPTNAHAGYAIAAARAGKAIFCEKPIDLSLPRVLETLQAVEEAAVPMMLAFNQRLDPNFAAVREAIDAGKFGTIHSIHIISRDPAPPPVSYIKASGGLFMDMTIHDLDMASHLVDSAVAEVYARGFNLVDPEIGKAGDIDSAVVILTFRNNVTVTIHNSRRAVYGYDQRLEVFGSEGMMQVGNPLKTTGIFYDLNGGQTARHLDFFIDRYSESYLREMNAFIQALQTNSRMPITGRDGLRAMILALAANLSAKENRPVKPEEIYRM
ncbi:MAG TPA: inositol 2-dehydrogenase [Flavitalea sp.]|nr:inositol 2-dehydrogenase [Flavitalea sp.]